MTARSAVHYILQRAVYPVPQKIKCIFKCVKIKRSSYVVGMNYEIYVIFVKFQINRFRHLR